MVGSGVGVDASGMATASIAPISGDTTRSLRFASLTRLIQGGTRPLGPSPPRPLGPSPLGPSPPLPRAYLDQTWTCDRAASGARHPARHIALDRTAERTKAEVGRVDYIAIIHKDPNSDFGVSFPDFPGCTSAGRTLDEAKDMAAEALHVCIEEMHAADETVTHAFSSTRSCAIPISGTAWVFWSASRNPAKPCGSISHCPRASSPRSTSGRGPRACRARPISSTVACGRETKPCESRALELILGEDARSREN